MFKLKGISNKTSVKFFTEKTSDDVKKNFIGVFPSNFVTRFIIFHSMLIDFDSQYPFVIMNTDQSDKKGTHWWSFLDLYPKKRSFYSIVSALKVYQGLFKMIRKYSIKYFMVLKSLIRKK